MGTALQSAAFSCQGQGQDYDRSLRSRRRAWEGKRGWGQGVAGSQLATQAGRAPRGTATCPEQAARVAGAHAGGSWGLGTLQAAMYTLEDMRCEPRNCRGNVREVIQNEAEKSAASRV